MKKHLILLIMLVMLTTGCSNVKDLSIEETLDTFAYKENDSNIYRVGYKYNLPSNMQVDENLLYNEVLTNSKYNFYLYIDAVSYLNKIENLYVINDSSYYSNKFEFNDKFGYLEINKKENDKYLIEIMYNYAKIEVMVDEIDINTSILYSINVLKSIQYNDIIIENILGEDVLSFTEEEYNIFNTDTNDNNYLDFDPNYAEPETDIIEYDPDLIN